MRRTLLSTGLMWAYGVARREVASSLLASSKAAWAFRAAGDSTWLGRAVVRFGSIGAPLAFVVGFALLGCYAFLLVRPT